MTTKSHCSDEPKKADCPSASCSASSILRLTLKRQWFDMIDSGKKMEEYRDPSPWIYSRLLEKDGYTHRKYDRIEFKNGYGPNVPTMSVEFKGWKHGIGMPKWGATPGVRYVVILLGSVIFLQNTQGQARREATLPEPPCSPS